MTTARIVRVNDQGKSVWGVHFHGGTADALDKCGILPVIALDWTPQDTPREVVVSCLRVANPHLDIS